MKKLFLYLSFFALILFVGLFLMPAQTQATTAAITKARFDSMAPNNTLIYLEFTDHVYGAGGVALTAGDFIYTDNNAIGMTGIVAVTHNPGDKWAILAMDAPAVGGDTVDQIEAKEGCVFTVSGALPGRVPVALVDNLGAGPILRSYTGIPLGGGVAQIGSPYILLEFQSSFDPMGANAFIPVYGPGGATVGAPVSAIDLVYLNFSGTGSAPIISQHSAGDYHVPVMMSLPTVGPEIGLDSLDCSGNPVANVTDLWGNQCVPTLASLIPDGGPAATQISKLETAWQDSDGEIEFIDTLRLADEPVYGSAGLGMPILPVDFLYTDGNGVGVSGIASINHSLGSWAKLNWTGTVRPTDFTNDIVGPAGIPGTDLFGNPITAPINPNDTVDPVIISAQINSDSDLQIIWSEGLFSDGPASVTANNGAVTFTSTDTSGNPTIIWQNASTSWNTDATGSSAGVGYDSTGTNQNVIPNISIPVNTIKDRLNNGNPVYTNYDTAVDSASPVIYNFTPANGATNVNVFNPLVVNFSEKINASGYTLLPDPGGVVATWNPATDQLTLSHNSFTYNTGYNLTVTNAQDNVGNNLLAPGPIGVSSAFTTGSKTSAVGSISPTNNEVLINSGDDTTDDLNVTLSLSSTNASMMLIDNDPNYPDAEWETYSKTKSWTLTEGEGEKTVYVKFKSSDNNMSSTVSDSIEYAESLVDESEEAEEAEEEDEGEEIVILDDLSVGDLIKSPDLTTVYLYGSDGMRHAFPNEKMFYSWGYDFNNVKEVSNSLLAQIMLGKNITIRQGTYLVKIPSDEKVYLVEPSGIVRWLETEAVASQIFGSDWANRIVDINESFWPDYSIGNVISGLEYGEATLFVYNSQPNVYYYLEEGRKRLIENESAFELNRFSQSFAVSMSDSESFADGININDYELLIALPY